jgi:hypothetical protein
MKRLKLVAFTVDGREYEVKKAYVNGYDFGDRLLEGVIFEITIVNNKIKAKVVPDYASIFLQLNEKKWLKTIEKGINKNTCMCPSTDLCKICEDEVYLREK